MINLPKHSIKGMLVVILMVTALVLPFGWPNPAWAQINKLQAEVTKNKGWELLRKQDYQGAIECWESAIALYRELGEEKEEAEILYNLGVLASSLINDYEKAQDYYEQALAIYQKLDIEEMEATTLRNLGVVLFNLFKYEQAMDCYEQALDIYQRLKSEREAAETLNNMGNAMFNLGQYSKALGHLSQALAIYRKPGVAEAYSVATTWMNLGVVAQFMGQYDKALEYFYQSLSVFRSLKERKVEASLLHNLGVLYQSIGRFDRALESYDKALSIKNDLGLEMGAAITIHAMGTMAWDLDEDSKALGYFQQALAIFRKLKVKKIADEIELKIADIQMNRGQFIDAWQILEQAKNCPLRMACYYLRVGEADMAVLNFGQAINNASEEFSYLTANLIGLGQSHEALRHWEEAVDAYNKAINLIENARNNTPASERKAFFEAKDYSFRRSEAYEGLSRVLGKQEKQGEAFHWSEHIKARSLLESMARVPYGAALSIPWSLREKELDFINRIASLKKRIDEAFKKGDEKLRTQLEGELKQLKQEQADLIAQLRHDHPAYASIQYPQPLKAHELALNTNEVLFEFEVTDPLTNVFIVRSDGSVGIHTINLKREELEDMIKQYREPFETVGRTGNKSAFSDLDVKLGHQLYELLLEPALEGIKDDEKILIVPDEMLCLLPFEALVEELPDGEITWEDSGQGPYPEGVIFVGQNHVFTYWQSASALTTVRNIKQAIKGKNMLVVADPVFNYLDERVTPEVKTYVAQLESEDKLKLMRDMIGTATKHVGHLSLERLERTKAIADLLREPYQNRLTTLLGFEATETNVKKYLSQPYGNGIIFATHGIVDNRVPYFQQPVLVLTYPPLAGEPLENIGLSEGNDGFLTMYEIMDLKIPTEVVATLACLTGVGKFVGGEGVMHLGRAFQHAGARSVLISLWSVADESTNLLGERFFTGIENGEDKDTALLAARQELIAKGYAHPFYWAPFILVGERDIIAHVEVIPGEQDSTSSRSLM